MLFIGTPIVLAGGFMRKVTDIIENILGSLCVLYYVLVRLFFGEIVSLWIWLFVGIALIEKSTVCILVREYANERINKIVRILSDIYNGAFAVFLFTFICFLVFVIHGMTEKHSGNELSECDACIVLGAAVYGEQPSPVLSQRIAAAYEFLVHNPNAVAVCTGGIGASAYISEAECIKRELIKKGIPEDRLIIENKSSTTVENMKLALALIPKKFDTIAVITSGFHASRAKLILSRFTNADVIGIPASGGGVLMPHYVFREYVVFAVDAFCGRYSIFG